MHQARGFLGVAVVDGKIYAIGGEVLVYQDPSRILSKDVGTNEEYDPATNTWTYKTPMPVPNSGFATAVYQGKIYCISGNLNEAYDPANDTWETKTPMPSGREWVTGNILNGKIYVIGGYPNTTLTEIYDPATDNWTVGVPMSIEPFGPSVVYNGKIYVLWGKTEIFDPTTNAWSFGTPPPISYNIDSVGNAIGMTTGFMAWKRMYVFGGGSNQVYDPATDSWTVGANVPISRGDFAVATVDDLIYIIGGISISYEGRPQGAGGFVTYYPTVEQYTPFGYGLVSPVLGVASPTNSSETSNDVTLNVTVNRAVEWLRFSLDGKANVTLTGNTTLTGLSAGLHNLTVYAQDDFGNVGASKTVIFTVTSEPFPTVPVAAGSIVLIVAIGVGLAVYFKKRKHIG